jgi:hypothetical protein
VNVPVSVRSFAATLIIGAGPIAPAAASAQGHAASPRIGFAVGGGAMYGNLHGGDFSGTRAAAGFDATAGILLRRWQLGVGYDRTNHGREETDGAFVVSNIYVEPRLSLANGTSRLTPYAAVRLGRAMATYEGVLGITDKAAGYMAGVGGGALWFVASHVQADAAVQYDRLSHDYRTGGYADAEKGGRASARFGVRLTSTR